MADTNETTADATGKSSPDATFMMECLKHLQNPASIDIAAVAEALNYKNPASVANRVRVLKKKFDLQVTCSYGPANSNGSAPATPRKGAKVTRGPIKAKPEPTAPKAEDEKAEKAEKTEKEKPAKKKPGRKPGRKAKAAAPRVEEPVEEPEKAIDSDDA